MAAFGSDPVLGLQQAMQMWLPTTGAAVFELLENNGESATHFPPGSEGGFPGWHMIGRNIIGFGTDADPGLLQTWMHDRSPWVELADVIDAGLDREVLNGIKLYLGGGRDFRTAEIRINGRRDDPASEALHALDWPQPEKFAAARTYLLLVHRA